VDASFSSDSGIENYQNNSILDKLKQSIDKQADNNESEANMDNDDIDDDIEGEQLKKENKVLESLSSHQDLMLNEFIKKRIPNAILIENIGTEMTYSISNKLEYTRVYESFFHDLEMNMEHLGIDSIGISDTTLEEIFIKLAREPQSNQFKVNSNSKWECFKKYLPIKMKSNNEAERTDKLTEEEIIEYSKYTEVNLNLINFIS
jgi:hypothetical protein